MVKGPTSVGPSKLEKDVKATPETSPLQNSQRQEFFRKR
jgi:hypothetical protein